MRTGGRRHLRADEAGHAVCEAEVVAHLEAFVESVDVAQVASRDDHPVGHLHTRHAHQTTVTATDNGGQCTTWRLAWADFALGGGSHTSQSNCWQISMAAVFCPSSRKLFMLFAR